MKKRTTLFWSTNLLLIILILIGCDNNDVDTLNIAPSFIGVNNQELTAGETKSIIITASDVNGDSLTLSIKNNPGFLSLEDFSQHNGVATATLVIAPEKNIVGVFDVCLVACDCNNSICEYNIIIAINTIIPIMDKVSKQTITTERYKEIKICAVDIGGDNLNLTLKNKPEFVYIKESQQQGDTLSAILAISPGKLDKGNYEMTVLARDEHGAADSTSFEIEVNDPINVITVYFCGTKCTKDMWDPNVSIFGTPELVATLHKEQLILNDSIHNYYKFIVDGIGSGEGFLSFLDQASPTITDAWNVANNKAVNYVNNIIANESGEVLLNIVGFSRGGILCMKLAESFNVNQEISGINIIAFDPVAGDDFDKAYSKYLLSPKVKHYVGIYAEDERTRYFHPFIPICESSETNLWIFTTPGSHETMVGNIQKGGHSIAYDNHYDFWDLFNFKPGVLVDPSHTAYGHISELSRVSWVSKVVATELFNSNKWGNVKFNWEWNRSKNEFINKYGLIFDHDYKYMNAIAFLFPIFKETGIAVYYKENDIGAYYVCSKADMKSGFYYQNPRIAYRYNGVNFDHIGLTNEYKRLIQTSAWNELLEMIDKPK